MDFERFGLADDGLEDFLVGTYLVSPGREDIVKFAASMASEQTTGTWVSVPGEDASSIRRFAGKVLSIWRVPDFENETSEQGAHEDYILQLAYPMQNVGYQLPMVLTTAFGNISMFGEVRLLDLTFPNALIKGLPHPRFGIAGVRRLLGTPVRPLLNTMIKPSIGISPSEGAERLYQAAAGGADIIKDDEVLGDPAVSPFERRLESYMELLLKAESETGEKKLYAINVTDEPERALRKARTAVKNGARALMVNFLPAGIGLVSSLARDPEVAVPILAHLDFGGALYASPRHGVSSTLIYGKLARLAGVDLLTIPTPYGKFALSRRKYYQIVVALRNRLREVPGVFPIVGGGISPAHVPALYSDLGTDFVVGAGGAVYAHPAGPAAGARAFRQAIDLVVSDGDLSAAAQYPELKAALQKWGSANGDS